MSSPNLSTSYIEDAFSSMNILYYTSVSSDYFPVSSGSSSFNSLCYAKELPISSPDPIIPPAILTPSPVLPPSLLFDPRYFFVREELLPPKKQICSPPSSSTTLPNPSRNQTCDLVSPSSLVYTPTPPQIFEIRKCSVKMHLKHHEKQFEDILNYLEELSFHRIEKWKKGMPPKRTSTSAAPAMTQVASRQLVADSVATALKAQAATMAITDNTNKNTGTSETLVARKGTNDHKRKSLHCQVPNLQQGGSSDEEQQKQKTSHGKQPAITCHACEEEGHYKNQ
ncbi:hypothetical protein Tco_0110831 [Tanacetum coccineum]